MHSTIRHYFRPVRSSVRIIIIIHSIGRLCPLFTLWSLCNRSMHFELIDLVNPVHCDRGICIFIIIMKIETPHVSVWRARQYGFHYVLVGNPCWIPTFQPPEMYYMSSKQSNMNENTKIHSHACTHLSR